MRTSPREALRTVTLWSHSHNAPGALITYPLPPLGFNGRSWRGRLTKKRCEFDFADCREWPLQKEEPLPAHVIAERLVVRGASMTSLLDTLERRKLVERHPHPDDRRKILIHLTVEARQTVERTRPGIYG